VAHTVLCGFYPDAPPMLEHSDISPSDHAGHRAGRRELSLDGEMWEVYERAAGADDRDRAPSLVFECRSAIRRVRDYPDNWFTLSDAALRTLSRTR